MRIDVLSLFPEMFNGPFGDSITKRAVENGILDIHITDFRDFAFDKHHKVDDTPFGGGSGMVLKPEPLFLAIKAVKNGNSEPKVEMCPENPKVFPENPKRRVLIMDPGGSVFTQEKAKELAEYDQLIFICGHYEGFDARISDNIADEAISIGDFVLTGGELPAMVIIDAVSRMLPGVLGSEESAPTDSFYDGLLEFPQYTRPRDFQGLQVPEVLCNGDHAKIRRWRRKQSLMRTMKYRPDLFEKWLSRDLNKEDKKLLDEIKAEMAQQ